MCVCLCVCVWEGGGCLEECPRKLGFLKRPESVAAFAWLKHATLPPLPWLLKVTMVAYLEVLQVKKNGYIFL